jgi:predicted O-methyltransferase YrrM
LASLDEVRQNLFQTGYERGIIHFIKGRVEDTLPKEAPEKIALLRLDTDWYESTLHELVHLYPRLSRGGILIIDDYGHWKGSQLATDEYFSKHRIKIFLSRIDYTARLAVKLE